MDKQKTLILIDGHALAYRMFFALERTGMHTSTKLPTWAIYGFMKSIIDILKKIKPDAIAVSFDMSRKTFRTEVFEEYKAQREAMPDTLREQMQGIIEGVKALNIPVYMMENFEADDIIGTIATKAKALGHKSFILTGDQDSFQLIDKEGFIKVLIPYKNELIEYDTQKVYEKLAVYPEQIVDYKALRGDTSDNIPGVKGIGEKTAAKLLAEHKTLDNIYKNLESISSKSVKEKLQNDKEMAYKSQFLACINKNVDIDFDFENAKLEIEDTAELQEFFTKYEFRTLLRGLAGIVEIFNGNKIAVDNEPIVEPKEVLLEQASSEQLSLFASAVPEDKVIASVPVSTKQFIDTEEKLDNLIKELLTQKVIGLVLAIENIDIMNAKICGVAFAYDGDLENVAGKIKSTGKNNNLKTAFIPTIQNGQRFFDVVELLNKLKIVLENEQIAKTTHNAKFVMHALKNCSIELKNVIFDTMVADYVKDSSLKHTLKQQALSYLKYDMLDAVELLGKGKSAATISSLDIDLVLNYFSDDALAIYELTKYHADTFSQKEENLFYQIELPLIFVLYDMERNGVSVDTAYLTELSSDIEGKIKDLELKIYELAGEQFNINSPKQVGDILFEKMGIKPKGKKGKTGYSTSAEVLEELAQEYEIAEFLLEHRHLTKIKNTYIDTLPELVSSVDGRVHTTFNQTITTTGRLSSSNPNLQNIPTRTVIGNKIRGAFVSADTQKNVLIAADYSQIELRLLAHYSQDEVLINAFKNGEDIHAITAAKIFGVTQDEVTKDMRRKAKAVNFGIIYGQTRYGLAETISVSPAEAQEFINKYFETYPNIQKYMEETKIFAQENGYVETLYGRKRFFLNELRSSNRMIREFAQRAAINAPLQGSAADLIKIAMINLNKGLKEECKDAKIILQVHDELVVEVPKECAQKVSTLVVSAMELNQPLDVPLVVDINVGKTWKESKMEDNSSLNAGVM